MPDPVLYLAAFGAAMGVSALVALASGAVHRRVGLPPTGEAALPAADTARIADRLTGLLALAAGLIVGWRVLRLVPAGTSQALGRLLMIVLPCAVLIELVAALRGTPRWLAWLLRLCLAAASGRILLHDSMYLTGPHRASGWVTAALLGLSAGLLAAVWGLLVRLSQRAPGCAIPLALSQATLCGGAIILLAGYVSGGAAAGPPAAALAGTAVAIRLNDRWRRSRVSGPVRPSEPDAASVQSPRQPGELDGVIGVGVITLAGLLFVGRFFGGISTAQALIVLLSPLVCWTAELRPFRRLRPGVALVLKLALVAVPLALVVLAAKQVFDRDMAPLLGLR